MIKTKTVLFANEAYYNNHEIINLIKEPFAVSN